MEERQKFDNYMMEHFKNKGMLGYVYIKKMTGYVYDNYIKTKEIIPIKIKYLMQKTGINAEYQSVTKAVKYTLLKEGFEGTFADYVMSVIEDIVVANNIFEPEKVIELTDEEEEDEF